MKKETWTKIAKLFHDTYEEQAPFFGYITRKETRKFDPKSNNGKLMIKVCEIVISRILEQREKEILEELLKELPKEEIQQYNPKWEKEEYGKVKGFNQALTEIKTLIEQKLKESLIKMKKEIKEKCNHNAIAKGNGEKSWHCINCGKEVNPPKEKEIREKIIEILGGHSKIDKVEKELEETATQILELFDEQKQEFKRVVEGIDSYWIDGKGVLIKRADILEVIEK